jgi:hypothetical protein
MRRMCESQLSRTKRPPGKLRVGTKPVEQIVDPSSAYGYRR